MLNFLQKNKITEPSRLFLIFFGAHRVSIFLKNKKNEMLFSPNFTIKEKLDLQLKPVLWGYPVWRVKTDSSGSGCCNPDLCWHQLVGTDTRTGPWKKCFVRSRIQTGILKKYFWKQGKDIYKLIFFQKLISKF